jgi:transcriptional regulator with XRE-family HTH domain
MRQRREAIGMSQARLGRFLGLTFSQVQKYEKGSNRIGAGRLYLLAHYLGVPVQYFFEGLTEAAAPRTASAPAGLNGELAVLDDAFQSITDPYTRQSLLALVRSLAVPAVPTEAPRQRVG